MSSSKTRINLTVPEEMERRLKQIARLKSLPVTTVAFDLLRQALELAEDDALLRIAEDRERGKGAYVSHAEAWA